MDQKRPPFLEAHGSAFLVLCPICGEYANHLDGIDRHADLTLLRFWNDACGHRWQLTIREHGGSMLLAAEPTAN